MSRRVMLVTHPTRADVPQLAQEFAERLAAHGIGVDVVPEVEATRQIPTHDDADGSPVLVMTSGGHRVDTTKVAALVNATRVRRASADFVKSHTG